MLPDLCASIRYHHRQRVYAMEQRKRADLALGSFLRLMMGWSPVLDDMERASIRRRAADIMDIGERAAKEAAKPEDKRMLVGGVSHPDFREWRHLIEASIAARAPFDTVEAAALKEMRRLAASLPVWTEFAEPIPGVGETSLAIIVAEAGDLSNYPSKGHLWKRMGLAVIDGRPQGRPGKGATAQDWIDEKYSPLRRSRMWTIGDALIKAQGPYREVYLARKLYERERAEAAGLTVAPSGKIPAKRAAEFISDGHIHRRAQRYMEKRLLRDLWQAWRRATTLVPEKASVFVPAAFNHSGAGGVAP